MDRVTRKANLKKLQLPKSSGSKQQRTTRQSKKTSEKNADTAISSYFVSPSKPDINLNKEGKAITPQKESYVDKRNKPASPLEQKNSRLKRTKLDDFILKDPKQGLPEIKKETRKSIHDDDFVVPEKKIKRAPKLASNSSQTKSIKATKKKIKQTTIKSAFLRNEQMFAEIAALHCAADQFDGDDVQLALAISRSEADYSGIKDVNEEEEHPVSEVEDIDKNADLIRDKLKKYGFRTAEKQDYNNFAVAFLPKAKRLKSKWASKFTALTLRQSDIQLKKLQNNIESLLNNQFRTKPLTAEEQYMPPYELQSSLLKRSFVTTTNKIFSIFSSENRSDELFFVKDLFEVKVLPAGYLLKDWSAIQGRDFTPKVKSLRHEERLKKLEEIYQDLEAYFSSRKRLNWTDSKENLNSQTQNEMEVEMKIIDDKEHHIQNNSSKEFGKKGKTAMFEENVELDEMVKLLEGMQKDIIEIESDELHLTTLYDKKTKALLPSSKSLDEMEVSGFSLNTQATCNTTEKTRSNSPDLFADSDVEREEEEEVKNETEIGLNTVKNNISGVTMNNIGTKVDTLKDKSRNNSLEVLETDVMTYEVFSSEEVKNTPLLELNRSTIQELPVSNKINEEEVIDLTQDERQKTNCTEMNHLLNQSKPIEEIDLFAESPLQEEDIHTNSEPAKSIEDTKDETFKFTLSLETCDKESKVHEENTIKLSLSSISEKYHINDDDAEDDLVLREIAMDQTHSSFLNFEGSKQLETYSHKKIENTENEVFEDTLSGNDTIFRKLCEKYLKPGNNTSMATRQKTDLERSFSQPQSFTLNFNTTKDNNLKECNNLEKSFSQFPLPKVQSPQPNINFTNFTMDFEMAGENNLSLRRKYNSFADKMPKKTALDSNTILFKSHSFNEDKQILSIGLTQQLEEDTGEDDDGLILSDDEINYSIWQANKTANLQTSEQSDMENEIISISDVDSSDEENQDLLVDFIKKDTVDMTEDQLIKKELFSKNDMVSMPGDQSTKKASKQLLIDFPKELSFTDFENQGKAIEQSPKLEIESQTDFEILSTKLEESKTPIQNDMKFDRSEFGILEEYSEPIDFTLNLPTPTKVLTEASFLNSPTEKSLPMKRFSSCQQSSQKFKELLYSLDIKSPTSPKSNTINDFDEFDRLVYTSSLKTRESSAKKPHGLDKLLTAEISFGKEVPVAETCDSSTKLSSELQEIKCNNKTYTLRYDYSLKPDYAQLSESELLKQLYNFGIKPLKRKQAVKMLEYIYNQTHPILVEETVKTNDKDASKNKPHNDEKYVKSFEEPCTSKSALESESWSSGNVFNMGNSVKETTKLTQGMTTKFKLNLQDSCGQDMLLYSNVLKPELCDENYILQTNVTKKTPRPLLPFHIAWYNLVCSNRQLHETILMYEPIDLQEIYLFFKDLGYRYEPKDMKTFFDSRCIIFRYDLTPPTKAVNRHVRKSKNRKLK